MKKLIIFIFFISINTFSQSVTIRAVDLGTVEALKVNKGGIGLYHQNSDNSIAVGTFINATGATIRTHTNHPLRFSTNNSGITQMILETNGNVGIGTESPTERLHVVGNSYANSITSSGLLTANKLNIGGGTTINKFLKVILSNQQIAVIPSRTCISQTYTVAGVGIGDTIMMTTSSISSTISIGGVKALGTNQVEVNVCNPSQTDTSLLTGVEFNFLIIK